MDLKNQHREKDASIPELEKPIKAPAIFCGSKSGTDPLFVEHAKELGTILGQRQLQIIYGGATCGIMGVVADAAINSGVAQVVGVIPESLFQEVAHTGLSELVFTTDMASRKEIMFTRSDSAIILPGGYGTLDELFEILSLVMIGVYDHPVFILNTNNFFEHLLLQMTQMEKSGFVYNQDLLRRKLKVLSEPQEIIPYLSNLDLKSK